MFEPPGVPPPPDPDIAIPPAWEDIVILGPANKETYDAVFAILELLAQLAVPVN